MLTMKKLTLVGAAALCGLSALLLSPMAHAATYSDTGAAVLVWPKIVVNANQDTVLTITNQANIPVAAHCFYVNANSRCTNTLGVCADSSDCFDSESGFFGACLPGWIEVNFDIILTPSQPLAWSADDGLANSQLPCPGGLGNPCPGSNAGTRIPPVGEETFIGELKCIESDPITRLPRVCSTLNCLSSPATCCRADLIGQATIETANPIGTIDTATYNAVGLRPTAFNDGDGTLVIGGTNAPEYQPCSQVLVLNHLFDNAIDPISLSYVAHTELSLVPCSQDFLLQAIPRVTAQFLVFNEFEQRTSASIPVNCLLDSEISLIDTSQPNRSIFNFAVQGTVAGQTRITGVNGGLIGAAVLRYCASAGAGGCTSTATPPSRAAYNLNQFADRTEADIIRIP